jgi:hypothetical protein
MVIQAFQKKKPCLYEHFTFWNVHSLLMLDYDIYKALNVYTTTKCGGFYVRLSHNILRASIFLIQSFNDINPIVQ